MFYSDYYAEGRLLNRYTLTETEKHFIIANPNMSSRSVAKHLWGHYCRKSTINDFRAKTQHSLSYTPPDNGPNILIFDIETAPSKVYTFGRYKQYINEDFVIEEGFMLSFCATWYESGSMASYALPYYEDHYQSSPTSDEKLVRDLHKVLSEADIIVAHYVKGFDWKVAQTRFLYYGLPQIPDIKLVDTVDIAKANFKFPNNKLDTIARYLGVGQKLPHSGASLWRGCLDGDEDSWKTMVDYNTVDVEVLEKVYTKLRAYDKRHPNVSLYYRDDKLRCTVCGSEDLSHTDKKAYSGLSEWNILLCNGCNHHVRARNNLRSKSQMKNTLANIM